MYCWIFCVHTYNVEKDRYLINAFIIFFLGIITLTNIHKLLNNHAHVLNVSVSDGVYTTFARVRVEILSANKNNPIFERHLYEAKISENINAGKKITTVLAHDHDSGIYGSITYSIISDYLNDNFAINNITGNITAVTI